MNPRKIYAIAIALSKSQLRTSSSGRLGGNIFRRPVILLVAVVAAFVISAGLGYLLVVAIQQLYPAGASSPGGNYYTAAVKVILEALIFVPTFVPSSVLLGGLIFELNVSSKFSASDTVNWLPVTQAEYVVASSISVACNYSVIPAIFVGITLFPSLFLGYAWLWVGVLLLSVLGLFTGGVLVEILRAAVNRVSSLVSGRARRGAFVLRLLLVVVIILVIDTSFNPSFLVGIVNTLSTTLTVLPFVPILWGSIAIEGVARGDLLPAVGFSAGTVLFTVALVWVALRVRSRYWSPTVAVVSIGAKEYAPRSGRLVEFGLTRSEAAIVRKDLKGVTRRRELISFFAVPIVFVVIFLIDSTTPGLSNSSSDAFSVIVDLPIFLAGTIFALMVSSISFGQESKSVMVLYSLPVSPDQILKAKAFLAMGFALLATMATLVVFTVVGRPSPESLAENIVIAVAITVEEVFLGLGFGAAHPDFQERPRPRFVDPYWLMLMILVGFVVSLVTAVPIVVRDLLGPAIASAGTTTLYLVPAALVFASVVTFFAYRWTRRSVRNLMAEYRI